MDIELTDLQIEAGLSLCPDNSEPGVYELRAKDGFIIARGWDKTTIRLAAGYYASGFFRGKAASREELA